MKEGLRRALSRAVVSSGSCSIFRRLFPKNGTLVLYGHRVDGNDEGYLQGLSPSWFADQIEYITRHYEVISLSQLLRCFESGCDAPSNSVVLTFDDGFRDNFENAFPVLQKFGIPATIFVVTGCLSTGQLPWPQKLGYIFQRTEVGQIQHSFTGGVAFDLTGTRARRRSCLLVKRALANLVHNERELVISDLCNALQVVPPRDRMMTWEQARAMQACGVEFGAHTYSHSLLANIPREEARREMEVSRCDLQENLGVTRPSFCFPGGSYDAGLVDMVKALGFRSVFQSSHLRRINNLANADQFSISRVGFPNAPAYILEAEIDGPFHAARRVYRRVDAR